MASSLLVQMQRQLLLAELAHQLGLVLDQDDLAVVDHADAVGHFLGLVDVVGGQDDGHARKRAASARPATCPCAARRRRRRSARRETGSAARATAPWRSARRRFMPPDSVMILLSFRSHSERSLSTFAICAGSAGLPNSPRLKRDGGPDRLERVGGQLLRHETDHRARGAVVA